MTACGDCCPVYFCPGSGNNECPHHGGFDTCCDQPGLHRPPDGAGPCMAVWRNPGDQTLVACADQAPAGQCWCAWHSDRANGRVQVFRRRDEAVRVQSPNRTVEPAVTAETDADRADRLHGLVCDLTTALNTALKHARPPADERERLELAGCLDTLAAGTRAIHGPDRDPTVHRHLATAYGPPRAYIPDLNPAETETGTNLDWFYGCSPAVGLRVAVYDPYNMLLGAGVVTLVDISFGTAHIDITPGSIREVDRMPFPLPDSQSEE